MGSSWYIIFILVATLALAIIPSTKSFVLPNQRLNFNSFDDLTKIYRNNRNDIHFLSMNLGEPLGYTELSVREVVELTMQSGNDYTYVDIRSPAELEELVSPKGAVNIPSFRTEDDWRDEEAKWVPQDDFIKTMDEYFEKDSKMIIGCKCILRQMRTCERLVEAGFTNVFLAESNSYLQTRGLEEF